MTKRMTVIPAARSGKRHSGNAYNLVSCYEPKGQEPRFNLATLAASDNPTDVGCRALQWCAGNLSPDVVISRLRASDSPSEVYITQEAYDLLKDQLLAPSPAFELAEAAA